MPVIKYELVLFIKANMFPLDLFADTWFYDFEVP